MIKLKIKPKLKSLLKILAATGIFLLSTVGADIFFAQTSFYKLDKLALKLNDSDKHNYYSGYKPALVRVTKRDVSDDLVMNAYVPIEGYFKYNAMVENVYQTVSTKTVCGDIDISILSQRTFSITEEKDEYGGYTLDNNQFSTYYGYDFLSRDEMISTRFGAAGFVFISDSFADKLLEKNGLTSYDDLLLNEQYSLITINNKISGSEISTYSINNIIYSEKNSGPITKQLYGDFMVAYLGWKKDCQPNVKISLDFQLKVDSFGNARTLRELNDSGYGVDTCDYEIKIYDYENDVYINDTEFVNELGKCFNPTKDILFFILGIVFFTGVSSVMILTLDKFLNNKELLILELIILGLLFGYGITLIFIRIPWILSVAPVIGILLYLILISTLIPSIFRKFDLGDKKDENIQ